ncbi:MAG: thermonuclease family protein [Candidatus Omnitrophota bacterium]
MKKINISGLAGFFLTLIVAVSFVVSGKGYPVSDWKISFPFSQKTDYNDILVVRVVDGDTLKLGNGERLRLIGIDTPEMHDSNKLYRDSQRNHQDVEQIKKLGRRSYGFTRNLVEGKKVRLEFDLERKDKYGRLLAYVYLQDGTFINAEIVKQGFASLMTIPPNVKYADTFFKFYQEARENNRGLWR